ncbi:MAG: diaminopimelate decarboxylase [Actinobacteria bacterium]|nr:diaminopimelate decarboxylase [Actinomycetota bacterium]
MNSLAPNWLTEPAELNSFDHTLWPKSMHRDAEGHTFIGGVPVGELAQKYGTPLYVLDKDEFFDRAKAVISAFDAATKKHGTSAKIYYAGKALLTSEVVRWVDQLGLYLDTSSAGELAVALAGGISPTRLGLHGNNKSHSEIGKAVTSGLGVIVIDSEIEVERIASAAGAQDIIQPVRLRVNSGVHAHTHEYLATAREDQKFGIAIQDVPELVAKIRSLKHLHFIGLHSHIGSQIFAVEGFVEAARRLVQLHAELLKFGPVPELNLGGGFGVKYTKADQPMTIESMATAIVDAVAVKCAELGIDIPVLAFEPGRVIAGPAGITLYNVGTTKDVAVGDAAEIRKYVSIDGGMSDNARPALYSADYSVALVSRSAETGPALVRVVGKHCESGDIVVKDAYLPEDVSPNDLLAIATTGAYCFSLASNYNYLARPAVVAVSNGQADLLVRAETETDLLSRDAKVNK